MSVLKLAVIGATGLVGRTILKVLEERALFRGNILLPIASQRNVGGYIQVGEEKLILLSIDESLQKKPDVAIFSAGKEVALRYVPLFAEKGTYVIDNSSAFRMDLDKKLIVPEVNASCLEKTDKIIANPNCSTIQMVMALAPLHKRYKIKRVVVSTYQAVTGSGKKAVEQLYSERTENSNPVRFYSYPIDLNLIPQIDVFEDSGYTREELKMMNETPKIMGDESILVSATAVRVPVLGGHGESVNVTFENSFLLEDVRKILEDTKGLTLQDDKETENYPMPLYAEGKDTVFVGRLREDTSEKNTLNMWIVSDNLRKGAATNAVQIVEYLISKKWI